MNDKIKVCPALGCPMKDTCKRYKDNPSLLENRFRDTPFNNFTNTCKHYLTNEPTIKTP